ncbi:Histidine kinase osmosensor [Conoideocrella luteorostrata]|uniref:histidine kinase n=1 Tax=Conoideocrella luteorostrata TaxID=1105319 RepID=A0AAJ0CGY6_9HYPO|nr:Histidine kinase osmosensor [Conoideocrella luteorostrata]
MRISIREQLALLVLFAVLLALTIVSVPTWIFVHNFVTGVESDGLSLTASLKASRIASELNLLGTISQTVSTRLLLQQAYVDFYNDNGTDPFTAARSDLESAMSASRLTGLLQARLYSRNQTGGTPGGLLNVTGDGVGTQQNILLPYLTPNGSRVNLSDTEYGYPPSLYPNVTYENLGYPNPWVPSTPAVGANAFPGVRVSDNGGLLLGPMMVNESFALMSLTIPVRSLVIQNFILGYMTLIISAGSLIEVQSSREGLGSTGMVLLIGPDTPSNHFPPPVFPANRTYTPTKASLADSPVRLILPPINVPGQAERHLNKEYGDGNYSGQFTLSQYPSALDSFFSFGSQPNNARACLSSTNERGVSVAVGVARPQSTLVDWAVVVEKAASEAYGPINTLRKILLACVFGTAGLAMLLVLPCAHLSVRPIRRLKIATENSMNPPGYDDGYSDYEDLSPSSGGTLSSASIKGFFASIRRRFKKRRRQMTQAEIDNHRRVFKIPGRVEERKHFITDELTELTSVYNEMTDELVTQYTSLDEKVAERTRELEISKKAAEAANESKTLFIANISHELKTPLNGIMGICAVCMEDNDVLRIQHSLKTLYRSGELLLHLLEDLLSFSKNQISQQVRLEDKEFRLGEIRSQILSIFDKQVRESKIAFDVSFFGYDSDEAVNNISDQNGMATKLPALGPPGMGRLRDVYLWGDQHRILQVIINLVSNSLKFTPAGGSVQLRIRCIGEIEPGGGSGSGDEGKASSRNSSTRAGRTRHRNSAGSAQSSISKATTSASTRKDGNMNLKLSKTNSHVHVRERSPTPPRLNARPYMFEFEVEDTGRGIPKEMQEKVFQPFVQVDSSLSKKFGGTGLGLSICSQLAKLMDGSISVTSTEGVGSTFSLRIPLRHVRDRAPSTASSSTRSRAPSPGSANGGSHRNSLSSILAHEPPEPNSDISTVRKDNQPRLVGLSTPFFAPNPTPPPTTEDQKKAAIQKIKADKADKAGRGELRVLVADDNSTNIEVVSRMLKLEKVHNVTIAKDGQEAYELVKANMEENQQFDLIFMDVQMPNLDGLQSTRLIRKMGYVAPIVALTAFSEESNVKECMESGMDDFVSKPIRRPALKNVLTKFSTILEESEPAA